MDLSSDPRDVRDYAAHILQYLRDLELRRRPRVNYMSKQRDINVRRAGRAARGAAGPG